MYMHTDPYQAGRLHHLTLDNETITIYMRSPTGQSLLQAPSSTKAFSPSMPDHKEMTSYY